MPDRINVKMGQLNLSGTGTYCPDTITYPAIDNHVPQGARHYTVVGYRFFESPFQDEGKSHSSALLLKYLLNVLGGHEEEAVITTNGIPLTQEHLHKKKGIQLKAVIPEKSQFLESQIQGYDYIIHAKNYPEVSELLYRPKNIPNGNIGPIFFASDKKEMREQMKEAIVDSVDYKRLIGIYGPNPLNFLSTLTEWDLRQKPNIIYDSCPFMLSDRTLLEDRLWREAPADVAVVHFYSQVNPGGVGFENFIAHVTQPKDKPFTRFLHAEKKGYGPLGILVYNLQYEKICDEVEKVFSKYQGALITKGEYILPLPEDVRQVTLFKEIKHHMPKEGRVDFFKKKGRQGLDAAVLKIIPGR